MYNPVLGRFTAVDPLAASALRSDPQTFNRYVYVRNSPLVMTDPTGMIGDYYSYNGKYLGSDGKNDHKIYFATEAKRKGDKVFLLTSSIKPTSLSAVLKARDRAVAIVPGTGGPVQDLVQSTGQNLNDAITGMEIGALNAVTNGVNALTQPLGPPGAALGIPNPFEIEPLAPDNARQAAYAFVAETGVTAMATAGVGSAIAGPASAGSSLSVVPEAQRMSRGAQIVTEWLGPNAQPVRSGSDLMIRSADGTRTIRFDLINSHGDLPHINVQTWRNTVRGWTETTPNSHIYPK